MEGFLRMCSNIPANHEYFKKQFIDIRSHLSLTRRLGLNLRPINLQLIYLKTPNTIINLESTENKKGYPLKNWVEGLSDEAYYHPW